MSHARLWLVGSWESFQNWLDTLPARFEKQKLVAMAAVAEAFLKIWIEEIEKGYPPENEPLTKLSKTSGTTLIDSRSLIRKIKIHRIETGTIFVGIQKDETLRNGQNAAQVAMWNEYGTAERKPKNKEWLSIPLSKKAKIAGSPSLFPGKLEWKNIYSSGNDEIDLQYIDEMGIKGFHFWVDESGIPQYLNVKRIGPIPARAAFRAAFDRMQVIAPGIYESVLSEVFKRKPSGWKL